MTDPTIPAEPEPCEYCGAKDWNITATLIGCHGCGVVYGRVNGAWVLGPDTVPGSAAAAFLPGKLSARKRNSGTSCSTPSPPSAGGSEGE